MDLFLKLLQNDVLVFILLTLVPLVPALVVFGILRTQASIKGKTVGMGPFKGLQYDISGAGAFYFLLLLVSIYFVLTTRTRAHQEQWRIEGVVAFENSDIDFTLDDVDGYVNPKTFDVGPQGDFTLDVLLNPNELAKTSINIGVDPFYSEKIFLTKKPLRKYHEREIDSVNRIIYIKDKIILKRN